VMTGTDAMIMDAFVVPASATGTVSSGMALRGRSIGRRMADAKVMCVIDIQRRSIDIPTSALHITTDIPVTTGGPTP